MQLTSSERRVLATYQSLHGTQPTMVSLLSKVWWRYLLLIALAVIVILVLPTALAYLAAGIILGAVVRDLRRYWEIAQMWPMYEEVLDWDEIEALLTADQLPRP